MADISVTIPEVSRQMMEQAAKDARRAKRNARRERLADQEFSAARTLLGVALEYATGAATPGEVLRAAEEYVRAADKLRRI
jgi:hypothetical protein